MQGQCAYSEETGDCKGWLSSHALIQLNCGAYLSGHFLQGMDLFAGWASWCSFLMCLERELEWAKDFWQYWQRFLSWVSIPRRVNRRLQAPSEPQTVGHEWTRDCWLPLNERLLAVQVNRRLLAVRVNRRLLAVQVSRRLSASTECETVGCRLRLNEAEKETATGGRNRVIYYRQNPE